MGIYVHIPFCRSKCFYCGFYSVASAQLKEAFIQALCREIGLRKDYLPEKEAATLYFGGGTPSYLSLTELKVLVDKLETTHRFAPGAERTIEMNPEDLDAEKLAGLKKLNFNRISIGVQAFQDDLLKAINRKHSARQVMEGIKTARDQGFDNISIDLIMGLPGQSFENLRRDLDEAIRLAVEHISVYMLSIDAGSVLEKYYQQGKFHPQTDEELAGKYELVGKVLKEAGYEHYEISNFAREQKYSVHNTSYWQQKPYIGLGPSAHSYDLASRQWNVSNLKYYIESLNNNVLNFEREELNIVDHYNEYVMTNLRTMWGIREKDLKEKFAFAWEYFSDKMNIFLAAEWMAREGHTVRLTEKGWLVSDQIFSGLFL